MPKTVVSTPELKPNSSWYTRYSGDGTPDAASIRHQQDGHRPERRGAGKSAGGHDQPQRRRASGIPGMPGASGSAEASRSLIRA